MVHLTASSLSLVLFVQKSAKMVSQNPAVRQHPHGKHDGTSVLFDYALPVSGSLVQSTMKTWILDDHASMKHLGHFSQRGSSDWL